MAQQERRVSVTSDRLTLVEEFNVQVGADPDGSGVYFYSRDPFIGAKALAETGTRTIKFWEPAPERAIEFKRGEALLGQIQVVRRSPRGRRLTLLVCPDTGPH